jgi:hypothetical protein
MMGAVRVVDDILLQEYARLCANLDNLDLVRGISPYKISEHQDNSFC